MSAECKLYAACTDLPLPPLQPIVALDGLLASVSPLARASLDAVDGVEDDSLPPTPPSLDHRHGKQLDRRPVEERRRLVLEEDDAPEERREPERRERVRLVLAHHDGVRDR